MPIRHRRNMYDYGMDSQICECDEIWNVDANACTSRVPYPEWAEVSASSGETDSASSEA